MSRRAVLAGGTGLALSLSNGCTPDPDGGEVPSIPRIPSEWSCLTTPITFEGRSIASFMPLGFDRARDDASAVLAEAAAWSAKNRAPVIVDGDLTIAHPVVLEHQDSHLHFACARLKVRDDGSTLVTRYGRKIPMAFYVVADSVSLTGDCILMGQGVPGETALNGVYGEEVADLTLGRFTLSNMALGLHFMCCTRVNCGDLRAVGMWGLQEVNGNPVGAGSAQIISGCTDSVFGRLTALRNDKPARYLSVGKLGGKEPRNNRSNWFGQANVSGRPRSPWAQVTAVRSSTDSVFVGGTGQNVSFLLNIQQYRTDESYLIDNNDFGNWSGWIVDPPASSVDAGVNIWVEKAAKPIGSNRIGTIAARMAEMRVGLLQRFGFRYPQNFGLWCNSGNWTIERLETAGFAFGMHAEDCRLKIDEMRVVRPESGALRFGRGAFVDLARFTMIGDIAGPAIVEGIISDIDTGYSVSKPQVQIGRLDAPKLGMHHAKALIADSHFGGSVKVHSVNGGNIPLFAK